jgi:hypothetical protein
MDVEHFNSKLSKKFSSNSSTDVVHWWRADERMAPASKAGDVPTLPIARPAASRCLATPNVQIRAMLF